LTKGGSSVAWLHELGRDCAQFESLPSLADFTIMVAQPVTLSMTRRPESR